MKKENNFIQNLNILDGVITHNAFDIDERVSFEEQWDAYDEDILQISFGDRFTLDVGWYPSGDPEGKFRIWAILDHDWDHPLSERNADTVTELKTAIEKTAIFIHEVKKIKDIPPRDIQHQDWYILLKFNSDFVKNLSILDGVITYNCFDVGTLPKDKLESLNDAMLQIKLGKRFLIDVDWRFEEKSYGSFAPEGNFIVRAILDKDWNNFLSKIKCYTVTELKEAIERTAIFINELRRVKDIPFRDVRCVEWNEPVERNSFVENLNILDGKINYSNFIDAEVPLERQLTLLHDSMLQIGLGKRFLVTVGWFSKENSNGYFLVRAIQDQDWADPLVLTTCYTMNELKKTIENVVLFVDKIRKIKNLQNK